MGHEELKQIGVNAYGHRHKLLKGIEKLYTGHSEYQFLSLKSIIFQVQQNLEKHNHWGLENNFLLDRFLS